VTVKLFSVLRARPIATSSARSSGASRPKFRPWLGCGSYATGGDVARVINTDNGAQERKLVGGTQLVANRIAEQLGLAAETGEAGVVRLGSAVRSIVGWNSGMVSNDSAKRMASCSGRPPSSRITHH